MATTATPMGAEPTDTLSASGTRVQLRKIQALQQQHLLVFLLVVLSPVLRLAS